MAHQRPTVALLSFSRGFNKLESCDPLAQCLAPRLCRSFASQTSLPVAELAGEIESESLLSSVRARRGKPIRPAPHVQKATPSASTQSQMLTTTYTWPSMEPKSFAMYHSKLLAVPLRRDILHRAVIFEADGSRQGTASTKWRGDVHGSNRKILPQKGTGNARVGDKKSPIRRGGGVAFGPKPRDFSTDLQRKVYDLAWRTALSYRYRKGELIVIDDTTPIAIPRDTGGRLLNNIFEGNEWGRGHGRSMLVTGKLRERLFKNMRHVGEHGLVKDITDVDVKDLLETGRVVIEKGTLDALLFAHSSDLGVRSSLEYALMASKDSFLQTALPPSRAQREAGLVGDEYLQSHVQELLDDASANSGDAEVFEHHKEI